MIVAYAVKQVVVTLPADVKVVRGWGVFVGAFSLQGCCKVGLDQGCSAQLRGFGDSEGIGIDIGEDDVVGDPGVLQLCFRDEGGFCYEVIELCIGKCGRKRGGGDQGGDQDDHGGRGVCGSRGYHESRGFGGEILLKDGICRGR